MKTLGGEGLGHLLKVPPEQRADLGVEPGLGAPRAQVQTHRLCWPGFGFENRSLCECGFYFFRMKGFHTGNARRTQPRTHPHGKGATGREVLERAAQTGQKWQGRCAQLAAAPESHWRNPGQPLPAPTRMPELLPPLASAWQTSQRAGPQGYPNRPAAREIRPQGKLPRTGKRPRCVHHMRLMGYETNTLY